MGQVSNEAETIETAAEIVKQEEAITTESCDKCKACDGLNGAANTD